MLSQRSAVAYALLPSGLHGMCSDSFSAPGPGMHQVGQWLLMHVYAYQLFALRCMQFVSNVCGQDHCISMKGALRKAPPVWHALDAAAAEAAAANADAVVAYEAAREVASVQLPLFATAVLLTA